MHAALVPLLFGGIVCLGWVAEAACSTTNADGTCASCTDPATEFGAYCDACPCLATHGTCLGGVSGNGMCATCAALRYGVYCDRSMVVTPLLLEWPQMICCVVSIAMMIIVAWLYITIAASYNAEKRFVSSGNALRIFMATAPNRQAAAAAAAAAALAIRQKQLAKSVGVSATAPPTIKDMNRKKRKQYQPDDEPELHHVFGATDLRGADRPRSAVVNVRSPTPVQQVEAARLFASDSLSPSERLHQQHFGAPHPHPSLTISRPRQAASLEAMPVARGIGPGRGVSMKTMTHSVSLMDPSPNQDVRRTGHSPFGECNERSLSPKATVSSPPLPRFRPGDKIRRNAKSHLTACDFGGCVGEVLCGEVVVVDSIVVMRPPGGGKGAVHYGFTVEGGEREPSVAGLEDMFELVSSFSSNTSSSSSSHSV